jgi:site-specific recombinase XerD
MGVVKAQKNRAYIKLHCSALFCIETMTLIFVPMLLMKGVDLNTVRELMGHADMKMTLRYAHLAPESKLQAVKLLD